ncbi:uncharacterized protein LOC135395279 [Ornithodoros turicata]|uniref:uncharacterized protein LOC135395279 n=1 Tax=Ornithodoros turicata TaxID=34597 RepID=UPI003139D0E4
MSSRARIDVTKGRQTRTDNEGRLKCTTNSDAVLIGSFQETCDNSSKVTERPRRENITLDEATDLTDAESNGLQETSRRRHETNNHGTPTSPSTVLAEKSCGRYPDFSTYIPEEPSLDRAVIGSTREGPFLESKLASSRSDTRHLNHSCLQAERTEEDSKRYSRHCKLPSQRLTSTTPAASITWDLSIPTSTPNAFGTSTLVVLPEDALRLHSGASASQVHDLSSSIENSEDRPTFPKGMDDGEMTLKKPLCSRVGCCLALAVFLCLTLLLLFLSIYYKATNKKPKPLREFCTEDECHRATSYLTSVINKSIDACDDFYHRVCYRWSNLKEGVGFVDDAVASFYESTVHHVSSLNRVKADRDGSHIFVALLKSCSEFVSTEQNITRVVTVIRKHLTLPEPHTSWGDLVAFAVQLVLEHGIATVIDIGWEEIGHRLHLSSENSLLEKLQATAHVDRYKKYIAQLFHVLAENKTEAVLGAVMTLEERIVEIVASGSTERKSYRSSEAFERLSRNLSAHFWITAVNKYLPPAKALGPTVTILASGLDIIRLVLMELESAPSSVSNPYFNLLVAAEVLQYDFLGSISAKPTHPSYVCLRAAQRTLTQTWPKIVSMISGYGYHALYLRDLFHQIHVSVVDRINLSNWMDGEMRAKLRQKIIKSVFYTFSEADRFPDAVDYTGLNLEGSDFVSAYLSALAYEAQVLKLSVTSTSTARMLSRLQLLGTVYFDDSGSKLLLPTAYASKPLFYAIGGEQFHNFATVGITIAVTLLSAAASSAGPSEGLYALASASECYRNQFQGTFVRWKLPRYLGNSVFLWTAAVRTAYETLRKYSQSNMSPREFEVFWPRIQQLFFERYCLLGCVSGETSDVLSPLQRCVIPLQNMPEFAVAYNCRDGSRMNPVSKCSPL